MNSYIIESVDNFNELKHIVETENYEFVCLDIETDNKSEKIANIHGIGLAFTDSEAYYIPIRNNKKELCWSEDTLKHIYFWIYKLCQSHKLINWNIIYDVLVFENNTGYDISKYIYGDGILLKHLVDEERPFALKETAVKYLGDWADKAQEALYANIEANGGSTTKENLEMWKADVNVLGEYCCWDVMLTRKLYNIFSERVKKEGLQTLLEEEVMPLYREVTINMKRKGFHIDIPHFNNLKKELTQEISLLEDNIISSLKDIIEPFEDSILNKDYPIKTSGSYPKILAEYLGQELPLGKTGKPTLAKKAIENCTTISDNFKSWLLGDSTKIIYSTLREAQRKWFFKDNPDKRHIFNLLSNDHLGWLLFTALNETALDYTEGGKPQVDDDVFERLKDSYKWMPCLIDFKKLNKLLSTYVDGILDRQIDGVIYTSMLQFGTTSGRYSSANPNLQNQPRVKGEDCELSALVLKYTNAIRAGFIAPPGYVIVDADQSALEPRAFAHMSGDENLKNVFLRGEDMYSSIAKRMFGLEDCSVFKKDPNFLGKLYPEKRQIVKTLALAVTYGAKAGRIAQLLGCSKEEAQYLIDMYLNSYPGLKKYINDCHYSVKKYGKISTQFGRVRHLPHVKRLHSIHGDKIVNWWYVKSNNLYKEKRIYENGLNNSTNVPIQGLAAHIMNRAMIAIEREFKEKGIDGWIALQVHDQVCCVVKEEQAEIAKDIVRHCMENTVKIDVPLIAEPKIAHNLRDSH